MRCWIVDLWREIAWWLAGPIPILIVIALMLWAPRVRRYWSKVLLRIFGGLAASFVVVVVGFVFLLSFGDPKPQYHISDSPNGLHRATLTYQAGFLGRDVSIVEIASKNKCKRYKAYVYDGPSDLTRTTVAWMDDSHLVIKYHPDHENRYQRCEKQAADVIVACVPVTEGGN